MTNTANKPATDANKPAAANPALVAMPYDPTETHGPAHKYGGQAQFLPCAGNKFRLTATGAEYGATGNGKSGRPTCMALICAAARAAGATTAKPVTGLAIAQALSDGNGALAAKFGLTKAMKYAPGTRLPCPAWLNGYINGAAREGLLAKVSG